MNNELLDDIRDSFDEFWDLIDFKGKTIVDWAKEFEAEKRTTQANLIALYLAGFTRNQPTLAEAWKEAEKLLLSPGGETAKS